MALRRRPNYEDQDVRISILAGVIPRDRIRWCRLISLMSKHLLQTGRAIRSTNSADANTRTADGNPGRYFRMH
jgi:hypothetical protein